MPQRKSGIKELRKNRKHRSHNLHIKSDLKKTTKKFLSLIHAKDAEAARAQLKTVFKKLDKAVKRNLLPLNTAARRKSGFSRMLKTLAAQPLSP